MNRLVLILVFLFYYLLGFSQPNNSEYYNDLAKGFGYACGIEITNEIIVDKFPDLEKRVILAQMDFNFAHGEAVKDMQRELVNLLKMDINEIRKKQREVIYERSDIEGFSRLDAEKYLTNFKEERIKGKNGLYSEFVKILLRHNPKYKRNPIVEFQDGFVSIMDTDTHPKSKGLKMSMEYPMSWIIQEGKRPHIVKLLRSYNGSCSATILIKDLISEMREEGMNLTKQELDYIKSREFENERFQISFSEDHCKKYLNEMGLDDIKEFSFYQTRVEGQPAIVINASGILTRVSLNKRVFMRNYDIIYKNFIINIGFVLNDLNGDLSVDKDKYSKLFDLMVNSLVIHNKW